MLKKIFTGLYHFIWYTFAFIIINAAVLVTFARLALPEIGSYKNEIQGWVSEYMDYPVVIEEITAEWQGWAPHLYLKNVDLYTIDTGNLIATFDSAHLGIDLFASISKREVVPTKLSVDGINLEFTRKLDGSISISNKHDDSLKTKPENNTALSEWLLSQQHIIIDNAKLTWHDKKLSKDRQYFSNVKLELKTYKNRLQLNTFIPLPEKHGQSLSMNMDVQGNILTPDWQGSIYIEANKVNPADLLDEFPIRSIGGGADIKLWSSWDKARLMNISGKMNYSDFSLNTDNYKLDIKNISLNLYGERKQEKDWLLNINVQDLETSNGLWPTSNLQLQITENNSKENYRYSGHLSYLNIEEVIPFILAAEIIPETLLQKLHWQSVKGVLTNTIIHLNPDSETEDSYQINTTFENLGLASYDRSNYISGLDGQWSSTTERTKININSKSAGLNFSSIFEEEYSLSEIKADIELVNNESIELLINQLSIDSNNISVSSSGKIIFEESSPFIDVVVHLGKTDIENIARFLPKQTRPKLRKWITQAILGGKVLSGDLIYRGNTENFPFKNSEGNFKTILNVENVTLDYLDGWPPIDNLDAEILIDNDDLFALSKSGYIFDAKINKVTANIKNLSHKEHHVKIDWSVTGHSNDAKNFILQSPLIKNPSLKEMTQNVAGGIDLDMQLDIPLKKGRVAVNGAVTFTDTTIISDLPGLALEDVNGIVNFTRNETWASNVDALYHGNPVKLNIPKIDRYKSDQPEQYIISGVADKTFIINQLTGFFPSLYDESDTINAFFTGQSHWSLSLYKSIDDNNVHHRKVELSSNLKGIAIDLPYPFGKEAQEITPLVINTKMTEKLIDEFNIVYNNNFYTDVLVDNTNDLSVENILVGLGQQHPKVPTSSNISIQGELEELNLSAWLGLVKPEMLSQSQKNAPVQSQIIGDVHVNTLKMLGGNFNNVNISLSKLTDEWQILFDAYQVKGQAQLVTADKNHLTVDLEKLSYEKSEQDENKTPIAIDKIPELEVNIDEFTYKGNELGQLNLQTTNIENGVNINNLSIIKPGLRIESTGEWTRFNEADRSDFQTSVEAESISSMFNTFGLNTAHIKDGQTSIGIKANWDGAPMDFSIDKINGELDMQIGKGQLLDIDPSAGRLFGLLSIQTLPRRLTLDFSDLFDEGFAFDKIEGNFSLEQGNAYTNDLEMSGPAADIIVSGRTGLASEDYDQIATIMPKISHNIPVASALFGPVGIGVGAVLFIAGEIFESIPKNIDKILSYQYSIKGSWDNPNIEKVKKEKSSG
jgi:uncharacterized protein (TIGR02099 family)